jgi:hypothetical protein
MIDLRLHKEPTDLYRVEQLYLDGFLVSTDTGKEVLDGEQLYRWGVYVRNFVTMHKGNIVDGPDITLWKLNH